MITNYSDVANKFGAGERKLQKYMTKNPYIMLKKKKKTFPYHPFSPLPFPFLPLFPPSLPDPRDPSTGRGSGGVGSSIGPANWLCDYWTSLLSPPFIYSTFHYPFVFAISRSSVILCFTLLLFLLSPFADWLILYVLFIFTPVFTYFLSL